MDAVRMLTTLVLAIGLLTSPSRGANPEASALFTKGVQQAKASDFAGGLASLRQAIQADSSVLAEDDQGAFEAIIGHYRTETKSRPSVGAWASLGFALKLKGQDKEALNAYRQLQGLDANNAEAKQAIAELEQQVGASAGGQGGAGPGGGSTGGGPDTSSGGSPGGGGDASGPGADGGGAGGAGGVGGAPGVPAGESEEVKAVKEQLKAKEEELATAQKQIEELKGEVDKLKEENKKLQAYKTGVLAPVTGYGR